MRFFKIYNVTFGLDVEPDERLFGLDLQDKELGLYVAQRSIRGFAYQGNWSYENIQMNNFEQILSKNLPNSIKTNFVRAIFEKSR